MRIIKLFFILHISIIMLLCSCSKNEKDFSFVFMTDIHVKWEYHAKEGFTAAVNKINELNPEFVISGGDQIMDALDVNFSYADSLYDLYEDISSNLKMPLYNTIGNHEIYGWLKGSDATPDHPSYGKKLFLQKTNLELPYRSFNHKGWHFILLDVIIKTDSFYQGHIDSLQIEWLKKDLQSISKSTPIIISTHIPLFSIFRQMTRGSTTPMPDYLVVENSLQIVELFDEHNLKLVLQGHLHEVEDIYYKGVHYITGGSICGRWWKGPYYGHPEGFVVVDVKDDDFTWRYQTYGWDAESGKVVEE